MHLTNDRREYYRKHYLKSPHWQFVKGIMLAMWPQCQVCGSTHHLDVHHRNYRNLYDVCSEDLIVLCRAHHAFLHRSTVDDKKPSQTVVEERLLQILPLEHESPRAAYKRIAFRFFKAARAIELKYGIRMTPRARKALQSGKPEPHDDLGRIYAVGINPPRPNEPKKPKKKKFHHRKYDGHFPDEWARYMRVARRFFDVARKIESHHQIRLIPQARRVFRLPQVILDSDIS